MITRPLSWQMRARLALAHWIDRPFHRLLKAVPEFGSRHPEITRIVCAHTPLAGRRAVQITDLHLDCYRPRHDTVVAKIAGLKPDWIFVTGDLLTVSPGLPHLFRFLSGLRDVAPVYMTLGNHDHYSGVSVDQFMEWSERHKISLLINETVFIPTHSGELGIVGLDDPSLHRADLRCIPPAAPGRFTVMLAHAPNVLDHLDHRHAVDLILCGHAHGGQWRIPRISPFWLPYGCNGRTDGFYSRNGHRLYVNRGLGWSFLPIRVRCRPEILAVDWVEQSGSDGDDRPGLPIR
jgi:predicted MPP superfamily phosphohydrolase